MIGRLVLSLFIFFLPSQLGYHFWPAFSRVYSFKIDYLSPTIFFTDILLLLYLLCRLQAVLRQTYRYFLPILLIFLLALFNLIYSQQPIISLFPWLRTLFYLLFILVASTENKIRSIFFIPFISSTVLVIAIEIFQTLFQHSLDGVFHYLGERSFNLSTPFIAKLDTPLGLFIRPYSIFSHPNSLAGYLFVSYFIFDWLWPKTFLKLLVTVGIILTFSKSVIICLFLYRFFKKYPRSSILLAFVVTILSFFINSPHLPRYVTERLFLLHSSVKMILAHPLAGVGLNQFIPSLAKIVPSSYISPINLQPVHSLPVLFLSEMGLVGLFVLSIEFWYLYKKFTSYQQNKLNQFLSLVLVTGIFDHYWWTLRQNQLILVLVIVLIINVPNINHSH